MYPNANIWVIGHSLGGALASLLGITFGAPVVTFEPPGERMAAQRLHLPSPVRHFQSCICICMPTLIALHRSRQRTTSHTCGTQQTQSQWAPAQGHSRPVESPGTRWRAGATLETS